jgi:23S rRNA G2445 N2-methylase RlmL
MKYIGFITKGLEKVAEEEIIREISDVVIEEVKDKRIVFKTNENIEKIIQLRLLDDICVFVYKDVDIHSVNRLFEVFQHLNLQTCFDLISNYRSINNSFSLTLSFVGLESKDILTNLSLIIEKKYNWKFTERNHSNFDIRVFIDHGELLIGIRINSESLHNRAYKIASKPGSLKPTVAAALVQLATGGKKGLVVDTFCGSGTILCEALISGNQVSGSDIDCDSVEITKENLKELNYQDQSIIMCQNALKTHFSDKSYDFAISNLPWDKQIKVGSITELYIGAVHEYKRILKDGGVLCVLITKPELFIKHAKQILNPEKTERFPISLLGQSPEILIFKL